MDELDDLVNSTVNVEDEKYKQFHSLFSSPTAVPPTPTPQPQQPILTQQPPPQIQQQPPHIQQQQQQQQQQHVQQPQSIHQQQQQPIHRPPQPIQQPNQQPSQIPQQPGQQAPPKPQGQTRTTITLTQSQQQHYLSLPNQQLQQTYLHQIRAMQQNLINQQRTQQQQMGNAVPNQQSVQQPNGINNSNGMVNGGAKPIYMNQQQPGQQQQPSIQKMPATPMNNQQQPQPQMNNQIPGQQPQYTQQQINQMNAKQVIQQRPQVLNSPQPPPSSTTMNNGSAKPMAIQQPSATGTNSVIVQPGQTQLTPQQQQQLAIQKQQQQLFLQQQQQQAAAAQQRMNGTTPINPTTQTTATTNTPITTTSTTAPSIQQQISQSFVTQQNGGISTPPITSQQPQAQQQQPIQNQNQNQPQAQPTPTTDRPVVDIQARVQNHFNALALAYRNAKIEKTTLMEHLVMLFGNGNAMNYAKKIDDIPTEKVPALPKDFDLDTILKRTNDLRQMTIQYQHQKTAALALAAKLPASNSLNDLSSVANGSINNNNNNANRINGQPVSTIPLTKEQKKELAKQIKQQKKEERMQKKINDKKAKDDRKANAQAAAIENKANADNDNDDDKQNIKDLNDVTKIAGVDMKNESDQFLPDTNEEDETYAPEAEPLFLNSYPLRKKITLIANKHGLKLSEENFLEFMSLATQDHLRTILEFLIKTSKQRVEMQKDTDIPITFTTDVKKQLMAIEKREKDEKTKRETEEQEKLMREAKEQELLNANSTSKKKVAPVVDDKSSNALKEKLTKIRMEKEEKDRTTATNSTAAIAVGNIGRKKPNLTSSTFMRSSLFNTANTQNIQPPIPNTQLISFQQLVKEGKELTPEQEIEFQKLKDAYGLLLKQYHEKIGTKDYQPMDIDLIGIGLGGVGSGNVGGRAGLNKQHPSRKITKKDCYFSQKHIGYNVLQKYELLKLRRRFNTNVFPF